MLAVAQLLRGVACRQDDRCAARRRQCGVCLDVELAAVDDKGAGAEGQRTTAQNLQAITKHIVARCVDGFRVASTAVDLKLLGRNRNSLGPRR